MSYRPLFLRSELLSLQIVLSRRLYARCRSTLIERPLGINSES